MRLYSFTNYYLSSIQQGIQTAHMVAEMSLKNDPDFISWAQRHKTIIVLNGGNSRDIAETYLFLINRGNEFSISMFKEDKDSLDDAMTCTGIVLPTLFCASIDSYRETGSFVSPDFPDYELSDNHKQLVKFIAEHSLAR